MAYMDMMLHDFEVLPWITMIKIKNSIVLPSHKLDHVLEQEMEIEALEAILMDEFSEIKPFEGGLNTSNRCFQITLSPRVHKTATADKCLRNSEGSRDWLTIISFIVALLAMAIATFSTGIDSKCFKFRKDDQAEDDVPYSFGFFHFVFATGTMYFAILLICCSSHHHMKKWTIDVGWTSTWARIVNEWLAVYVYLWMLVAPIVWKTRQVTEEPTK